MTRESMQQALDAFERMIGRKPDFVEAAIAALREALARPAAHSGKTDWARGFEAGVASNIDVAKAATGALQKEKAEHAEMNRRMTEALMQAEGVGGNDQPEPIPTSVSRSKRAQLESEGYVVNGVTLINPETRQRVLLDYCGFVGWYGPTPKDEK